MLIHCKMLAISLSIRKNTYNKLEFHSFQAEMGIDGLLDCPAKVQEIVPCGRNLRDYACNSLQ